MILHALKSFLYLTIKHASMESVQQYSFKKLNNPTSKHFPIVLLINSYMASYTEFTIATVITSDAIGDWHVASMHD